MHPFFNSWIVEPQSSQLPRLQEIFILGLAGGDVCKKTGEVSVHVPLWIHMVIDKLWRGPDRALVRQTVQGRD